MIQELVHISVADWHIVLLLDNKAIQEVSQLTDTLHIVVAFPH
jgi:hypothetical protein